MTNEVCMKERNVAIGKLKYKIRDSFVFYPLILIFLDNLEI